MFSMEVRIVRFRVVAEVTGRLILFSTQMVFYSRRSIVQSLMINYTFSSDCQERGFGSVGN
jgi:hypothetical protein